MNPVAPVISVLTGVFDGTAQPSGLLESLDHSSISQEWTRLPQDSDDRWGRQRNDELASAPGVLGLLGHNLAFEVPGKEEEVVGPSLQEHGRIFNRLMGPRHEKALLVDVAVDHELHEIGADANVVAKCRALGCGAVTSNRSTFGPEPMQEFKQLGLHARHPLGESLVILEFVESGRLLI